MAERMRRLGGSGSAEGEAGRRPAGTSGLRLLSRRTLSSLTATGTAPEAPQAFDAHAASRSAQAPAVLLSGISRVYGSYVAIAGVDLTVPRGQAVLLWGPNGAGKSTLLRMIATLISPTRGQGKVLGLDLLKERRDIRALIELVGHRTRLYEDLTPTEYLRFVASLWSCPPDRAMRERIPQALARAGLGPVTDQRIRSLSQGMRQRVAIARLLLRQPQLLLLDEPYGALDDPARQLVDGLVVEAKAQDRTVVLATHDVARAAALADRAVRLEAGRIVEDVFTPSLDLDLI